VQHRPRSDPRKTALTGGLQRIAGVTDNLVPAVGPTSRTASYSYTPSGRVLSGNGPWGNVGYAYDASGNLTQNGATTMSVATTSNQIASTSGATSRTLTYLAGGELSQDNQAVNARAYTYNAARRMVATSKNGVQLGAYGYDFAGRRVYRQTSTGGTLRTAYPYDEAGHVLAEMNATTGAVNREYVWLDDKLVAMVVYVSGNAFVRSVTTGQIDEPLAATASNQSLVWNGYTDPFGAGATFTVTLR
jgi:hypothetical protein